MQGEKALFMDFDFTLLKDDKTISEKNRRAVRQALAEGNCVVAATGRHVTHKECLRGEDRSAWEAGWYRGEITVPLLSETTAEGRFLYARGI